jgi:hypothetical protein
METVKQDGDGLVCRRPGAPAVADDCCGVSVTGSAEDGPRRRDVRPISTRAHAEQGEEEGSGGRRRGGVERDREEGARQRAVRDVPGDELHPGREELDAWAPARSARAQPMAAASSSPRPR